MSYGGIYINVFFKFVVIFRVEWIEDVGCKLDRCYLRKFLIRKESSEVYVNMVRLVGYVLWTFVN